MNLSSRLNSKLDSKIFKTNFKSDYQSLKFGILKLWTFPQWTFYIVKYFMYILQAEKATQELLKPLDRQTIQILSIYTSLRTLKRNQIRFREIYIGCDACQRFQKLPIRLRVSLPSERSLNFGLEISTKLVILQVGAGFCRRLCDLLLFCNIPGYSWSKLSSNSTQKPATVSVDQELNVPWIPGPLKNKPWIHIYIASMALFFALKRRLSQTRRIKGTQLSWY